jgi:hypothetical protein
VEAESSIDQPTGSIGWVAVAPSDPNIVYVGSGEGLPRPDLAVGDGIYKSTDAGRPGRTWDCATRSRSPRLPIDPRNANRLFVAALGHPYGPTRSAASSARPTAARPSNACCSRTRTPAARTSTSIPPNPDIVYATMWEQRQGPWENGAWDGTNGGIFKSTDGGTTWKPLTQGLPRASSTRSWPSRRAIRDASYATLRGQTDGTGIYRSDDAGETGCASPPTHAGQPRSTKSCRTCTRKTPDTLIVTDVVSYKSTDGGKTFVPFKGAPGGDDNQNIWWNPTESEHHAAVVDQGAVVTLNGGQTWSSWFTQPTAALYHVMTDNAFPYRVCGGQQDSGRFAWRAAATTDRSRFATGIPSASRNTATRRPIHAIPI